MSNVDMGGRIVSAVTSVDNSGGGGGEGLYVNLFRFTDPKKQLN